jgi:hypothetical protein
MPHKPNFVRKKKRKVHGTAFWDREYTNPEHLKLSTAESADLTKFTRFAIRQNAAISLLSATARLTRGVVMGET